MLNRQYRRMLAKSGKGDQFAQEMYKIGADDANRQTTTSSILIMSEVLHEKYGFGRERIKRVWAEWANVAECINEKKVSVRDIRDALADELKWPELKEVTCK